jgi:molybdenum cofactor cytidylyltransferase
MDKKPFAVLILAAGLSSRANSFKPLLPLGDVTITDHVISIFLQYGVVVYLVLGHRQNEVRESIKSRNVTFVENPDYLRGMFTSIQAGVRKLNFNFKWFFISPVDIPLISPATIACLMREAENNPDKIIYPVFEGRRGHPPLIPSSLVPAILGWDKDGGLNAVLALNKECALEVEVPDRNILFDIDTPEDYEEALRRFGQIRR